MANATSFNETFSGFLQGYENLITDNSTDILGASVDVWSNAGDGPMAMFLAFSIIPLIVMVMVYARTQRIFAAMAGMLFATLALMGFGTIAGVVLLDTMAIWAYGILFMIGIAFSAYNFMKGTE